MEQFWDKILGYLVPGYGVFMAWRLNAFKGALGALDELSATLEDHWERIMAQYHWTMARFLQRVAVVMAVVLVIASFAMLSTLPSETSIFGWHRLATAALAILAFAYAGYAVQLYRVKPKYRLENGNRVWNEKFRFFELDTNHLDTGWISATGFATVTLILLVAFAILFAVFGALEWSVGYSVVAYILVMITYGVVSLFESLVRFVAYRTSRLFVSVLPGIMDHVAVVFAGYTWSEARIERGKRAEALAQLIAEHEAHEQEASFNWSTKLAAMACLALFLQISVVGFFSGIGVLGGVYIALFIVVPTVKLIASATSNRATDELQSYQTGKFLVRYLLLVIPVMSLSWAVYHYWYYAGYACGLLVVPTMGSFSQRLAFSSIFAVLAVIMFWLGRVQIRDTDPGVKRWAHAMWAVSTFSVLFAVLGFVSLANDSLSETANACLADTKARVAADFVKKPELPKKLEVVSPTVSSASAQADKDELEREKIVAKVVKDGGELIEKLRKAIADAKPPQVTVPPKPPEPVATPPAKTATVAASPSPKAKVVQAPSPEPVASKETEAETKARKAIAFLRSRSRSQ